MQDIKAVKQLCLSFNAGEIDFDQYRKSRAEILDNLYTQSDLASNINSPQATTTSSNDQGFFEGCTGFKLMMCGLAGLGLLITIVAGTLYYFGII